MCVSQWYSNAKKAEAEVKQHINTFVVVLVVFYCVGTTIITTTTIKYNENKIE